MRQFILSVDYKSDEGNFTTNAHDTIIASSLIELMSKFNIVIASLHNKIVEELKSKGVADDDIPF